MRFEAGGSAPETGTDSRSPLYLLYRDREICLNTQGLPFLTREEKERVLPGSAEEGEELYLGRLDGRPCLAREVPPEEPENPKPSVPAGGNLPGAPEWKPIRPLLHLLPADPVRAVARGRHLLSWREGSRFCGRCGNPLTLHPRDMALSCGSCGRVHYPRISPAVITAVIREDRILLAHNRNFAGGMYSLIAGFVDPGETLEETVVREIREEVGLEVTDVRYRTSQPWPFPDSLMCAFTACWSGGEIVPDGQEIDDARWFSRDSLPEIPGPGSVSRELIDMYLQRRITTCQNRSTEG